MTIEEGKGWMVREKRGEIVSGCVSGDVMVLLERFTVIWIIDDSFYASPSITNIISLQGLRPDAAIWTEMTR